MGMMLWGDTSSFNRDLGQSPGALVNVAPLLWWGSGFSDAADVSNTAQAIATNALNSRNVYSTGNGLQGWGVFAAAQTFNTFFSTSGISELRGSYPSDALATASRGSDFLFKTGYDNTPPTTVTSFAVQSVNPIAVTLAWNAPASAADGETATKYYIYRGTAPGVRTIRANQLSNTTPITGTSYTDPSFSTGGPYYYKIVPVDDYNNWGPATELGPVNPPAGGNIVVESRTSGGTTTDAPAYTEAGSGWTNTISKSSATNPGLIGTGSRFTTTAGTSVTLRPNLLYGGFYDVYVTLDDATGGPNNNAAVNWTITSGAAANVTGSVTLAPTTPGLANSWLKLAENVPMIAGPGYGITFHSPGAPTNRFTADAVWFQLDSTGPAPLPAAITSFDVE
jgi:hypothetical protein